MRNRFPPQYDATIGDSSVTNIGCQVYMEHARLIHDAATEAGLSQAAWIRRTLIPTAAKELGRQVDLSGYKEERRTIASLAKEHGMSLTEYNRALQAAILRQDHEMLAKLSGLKVVAPKSTNPPPSSESGTYRVGESESLEQQHEKQHHDVKPVKGKRR